ncbi:MAG: hypothetical protein RSB70_00525 [Clostridium sp.]
MDKNKLSQLDKAKDIINDNEAQKYIKEMRKMDQVNEKKGDKLLAVTLASILVIGLGVGTFVSWTKPKEVTKENNPTVVINNPSSDEVANKPLGEELPTKKEESSGNTVVDPITVENLNELNKIYEYAKSDDNRQTSLDKAIELNQGSSSGVSAIMISQILRNNGYEVPEDVYSTSALRNYLSDNGFTKETDLSKLKPGDICFTKDMDQIEDTPSHTYIFIKWIEEGKTSFAQVVDSHVKDYGATLHERNIDETVDGKDNLNYFYTK